MRTFRYLTVNWGHKEELIFGFLSLFTPGSAYSTRVSTEVYSQNARKTTKEELVSLLRTVHESPTLSDKEKRRLLGQFYKGHPEIFVQYFGNKLSSINMLLQ